MTPTSHNAAFGGEGGGVGSSQDHAPSTGIALEEVFVVSASSGEWSDRVEWAVRAFDTEAAAKAHVDHLDARVRAAEALVPASSPPDDASERAWNRYWAKRDAALATIADIGGDYFDTRFFYRQVPFSSATGSGAPAEHRDDPLNPPPQQKETERG